VSLIPYESKLADRCRTHFLIFLFFVDLAGLILMVDLESRSSKNCCIVVEQEEELAQARKVSK
jgi:hypothetical protein